MASMSAKDRLLAVLRGERVDRPPVICPGGMMNAAVIEVMEATGHTLPAGHTEPELMAALALDIYQQTGFENLGVPFCMTVEAEVLGSEVDLGSLSCEPKIRREAYASAAAVALRDLDAALDSGRLPAVRQAVRLLAARDTGVPVIASVDGPVTTAGSLVEPARFLKEMWRDKPAVHRVLAYVADLAARHARAIAASGADVITLGDPTATGEILGPSLFEEFALPYLNRVIDAVRGAGTPVIVHICGDLDRVKHLLPELHAAALSTDAMVNLRKLKEEYPRLVTMGNVSTFLLESGPAERVADRARKLLSDGVDILAPACGLSTLTPLANIRAMTGGEAQTPRMQSHA